MKIFLLAFNFLIMGIMSLIAQDITSVPDFKINLDPNNRRHLFNKTDNVNPNFIKPIQSVLSFFDLNNSIWNIDLNRINKQYFKDSPENFFSAQPFSTHLKVGTDIFPGLMAINSGSIGFAFGNENFNFFAGGEINKYGYFNGMTRQLGVSGILNFNISSSISFTGFATYYINNRMPHMPNNSPLLPAMLGFYRTSRFGGYFNYDTSEHFGIQLGAQMVEKMGPQARTLYHFEPIATPYFNIGSGKNKVRIGLPIGQILYGIFQQQNIKKHEIERTPVQQQRQRPKR